jgi:serine/threonine protein kinase
MTEPPSESLGLRAGPWLLEARVGSGGQGDVYRARRVEGGFEQTVAIKVLRRQFNASTFQYEQENLAVLNHPCIANLLGTGTLPDGRPYFAMEYVDGKPIDQYANEHALSVQQRLLLMKKVCEAVAAAHRNLIVHLDLKPANILVNRDGLPKLLDFGLARRLSGSSGPAAAHEADAFSRPYASPEQVTPGAELTTSSDVYSLGAILYELLTGHAPFDMEGLSEEGILLAIRDHDPLKPSLAVARPRRVRGRNGRVFEFDPQKLGAMRASSPGELRRLLKGDLDNVILVALHKEERRRYPSVDEMSKDISRFLAGQRVVAGAANPTYRATRFARKRPLLVYAAALLAVAVAANIYWVDTMRQLAEAAQADERVLDDALCRLAGSLPGDVSLAQKIADRGSCGGRTPAGKYRP